MLRFEQLLVACVGQTSDEVNRLGPVLTEDQSASLSASVRLRYGRLTGVSGCVRCDVRLMNLPLLPPALRFSAGGDAVEVLGKL